MKTQFFKKSLVLAALLVLSSCIKGPFNPIKNPQDPKNDPPVEPFCKSTGTGMIESCPMQPEVWFINTSPVQITLYPMKKNLLAPVSLPQKYRQEGLLVTFHYDSLGDSMVVNCGCFQAPPYDYATKIKICEIEESKN